MDVMLAAGAALTIAFLVVGMRLGAPDRRALARVEGLREHTEFGLPVATPLARRPRLGHTAGGVLLRLVPPRMLRTTESLLERGGASTTAGRFLATWSVVSVVAIAGALLWASAAPRGTMPLATAGGAVLAMVYGPWFLLRRRAAARTREIDRALPQVLDLIVTNIECGLGLQAAMMMVAQKFGGPIALEFARTMREIAVGVPREDALNAMARRTGSTDVAGVARAIAQAERSGVSVGDILRARARELREHRRLIARELANKVPVKMTIPMVLFIFPTFFLLLLAPVAMNAAEVMGG